jgi:aryl-alcohol dehydrogenase-like predicted oxidoreductase
MVDYSLDHGVNYLDTANVYNCGAAEQITGRILQGRRNRVILASKVGLKMGDAEDQVGLSRRAIFRAIDETLQRLQTDYLDIYYLHQPDYSTPVEETLAALDHLVRTGKVRYPATSNYAAWQICRARCLAETAGHAPMNITQPMYNLLARGIEQEYFPMAKEMGVTTIVYNPLAGGLLTGKHKAENPLPDTRFERIPAYRSRYWKKPILRAVDRLAGAACIDGRTLVSVSLNWILHHSQADCVVLGASCIEQLQENIHALDDGALSPALLDTCDEVWDEIGGITPKYNR